MTESEFKLQILIENLRIKCRYYTGDEEVCEKFGYLDNGACFPACNCYGDINKCDLYDWAKIENLITPTQP